MTDQSPAYHYAVIARALRVIDEGGPTLTLDDLAARMDMSPAHFQRTFSQWVGISPKRYQQYLTLDHARQMLAQRINLRIGDALAELAHHRAFHHGANFKHLARFVDTGAGHEGAAAGFQRHQAVTAQLIQGLPNDGARHLEDVCDLLFTQFDAWHQTTLNDGGGHGGHDPLRGTHGRV